MGYTINWQRPVELPADRFAAAVADCRDVLPTLGIALAGFEGKGECILDADHVVINGQAPMCCEPFEIDRVEFDRRGRGWVWAFCKTQQLPYDLCIKVTLIIFAHHLGDGFKVGSDGAEVDWNEARRVLQAKKGYGGQFRRAITE